MTPVHKDAWGLPTVGLGAPIELRPHNNETE